MSEAGEKLMQRIEKLQAKQTEKFAMKAELRDKFKLALEEIMSDPDKEAAHAKADDLMVAVLKAMGFDLTALEDAGFWYA